MYEVAWQEFNKAGVLQTKRRCFKTEAAMEAFIEKLFGKDSFYQLLGFTSRY